MNEDLEKGNCKTFLKLVIRVIAGNCMFKVNNRNTRTRCDLPRKSPYSVRIQERRSGVFIVNFEHISHLVLVFLLLTLSK